MAHAGILRSGGGLLVEAAGFGFHGAGLSADVVEAQRLHQPTGLRWTKPLTSWRRISGMWSPNFCRYSSMSRRRWPDSSSRMPSKTAAEAGKFSRRPSAKSAIDALVFFLQGDGQRQNFALGKSLKILHGG